LAYFVAHDEIAHPAHPAGGWQLVLQHGFLILPDDEPQAGIRFIWRRDNGTLSSRPCRIDSLHDVVTLLAIALQRGWGSVDGQIHAVPRQRIDLTINGENFTLPATPAPTTTITLNGRIIEVPAGPTPGSIIVNGVEVQIDPVAA
jgi:hypothetical protein